MADASRPGANRRDNRPAGVGGGGRGLVWAPTPGGHRGSAGRRRRERVRVAAHGRSHRDNQKRRRRPGRQLAGRASAIATSCILWIAQILSQIAQNTISFVLIPQVGEAHQRVRLGHRRGDYRLHGAGGAVQRGGRRLRGPRLQKACPGDHERGPRRRRARLCGHGDPPARPRARAAATLCAPRCSSRPSASSSSPPRRRSSRCWWTAKSWSSANALFNFTLTPAQLLGFVVIGPVVVLLPRPTGRST